MDLSTAVSVISIALATGIVAGYGLSVMGWILVSSLLVVTLIAGNVVGQIEPVAAVSVSVLAIVGFNAGLFAGLVPRMSATAAA